jgi:hypothetical protein
MEKRIGDLVTVNGRALGEIINIHNGLPDVPRVEVRFLRTGYVTWYDEPKVTLTNLYHSSTSLPEAGQRVAVRKNNSWFIGTMTTRIRETEGGMTGFYVYGLGGSERHYVETWAPMPTGPDTPHFDIVTETGTTSQISLKNTATGKYVGMLQPDHVRGVIAALTRYVEEQDTEREAAERAAWLDDALTIYMGSVELDRSAVKERLARLYDAGYRKPTP